MKKIKLTQGKFALVSNEDFEWLSQWKWCAMYSYNTWYVMRGNHPQVLMHRLIMDTPKGADTHHLNHNGLDNRRCNLEICSHQQNGFNQKRQTGTSEHKGVSWYRRDEKWRAYIVLNNKQIHLGYYHDEIEAAKAYDTAAKKYYKEFALTNF